MCIHKVSEVIEGKTTCKFIRYIFIRLKTMLTANNFGTHCTLQIPPLFMYRFLLDSMWSIESNCYTFTFLFKVIISKQSNNIYFVVIS